MKEVLYGLIVSIFMYFTYYLVIIKKPIRLKRYMFEQNNFVLQDLLLDEIYEQLVLFVPQITVKRKDISFQKERARLYVTIKCVNRLDFTPNTYNLVLMEDNQ